MSYSNLLYRYLYVKNMLTIAKDEEGQGLVEYSILVALIAVVAVTAVTLLGDKISGFLEGISLSGG